MRVPLTTRDFLDRAELVYGDRVGIVDEPNQPAPPVGDVSYRDVARRGRALQAGLDALGIGEGERVAIVSHNAGRLLELLLAVPSSGRVAVPINFRLSPEEVTYIVGHSGSRVLLVDPELESSLKGVEAEHRFGTGEEYEQLLRFDTEPRPWSDPDEDATATINYTSGTTARRSSAASTSTASPSCAGHRLSGTRSWRPRTTGTARSPGATACGSSSPAPRRPRAPSPV